MKTGSVLWRFPLYERRAFPSSFGMDAVWNFSVCGAWIPFCLVDFASPSGGALSGLAFGLPDWLRQEFCWHSNNVALASASPEPCVPEPRWMFRAAKATFLCRPWLAVIAKILEVYTAPPTLRLIRGLFGVLKKQSLFRCYLPRSFLWQFCLASFV